MKLTHLIIGRILATWALVVFASFMLLLFPLYMVCFLLKDPAQITYHRFLSRIWMSCFLYLSGCRFKVTGKENFDGLGNAVIVCNHNSLIDIPVTTPFLPRPNRTIAKKSFVYVPLFGWIYQFASVIVDRKDNSSRRKSYDNMKRVLNNGVDMLIYPEGTRNKTSDPLKSFYDGAFTLSIETQKPIVPVVILNTKKILPAKPSMCLTPGKIILNILPPIFPEGHTALTLKKEVFKIMSDYYSENQK